MEFNKKDLLSLIRKNINEAPMDFDTPDRPQGGIRDKLSTGDTPLKKVPLPQTGADINFQELLASERYKQVVQKVREYTGIQTPMQGQDNIMPLAELMMAAHNNIIQTENAHKEELQQLAVELVMKEMGIPEGSLQFDAKIIGLGEISSNEFKKDMEGDENIDPVDIEEELMDDLGTMNLERAKRRLINSIIQGASKKGHYMYHMVSDRIKEITGSDNIINQYGVLMSVNDTMYWQLSDDTMKAMMGGGNGGSVGGKEEVDRNTNPPTIVARGVNFPILVHELIKGVMELFAIQGRPKDEEGNEGENWSEVEQHEDTFEKEVWDIRLGPSIWDRIRNQFPEDILEDENKRELQNYLLTEIFKLPARNFLIFTKEVLSGSASGQRLMDSLMEGINQMFKEQDYEDAINNFQNDLEEIGLSTDDDDLEDFLGSLGIGLPDEPE